MTARAAKCPPATKATRLAVNIVSWTTLGRRNFMKLHAGIKCSSAYAAAANIQFRGQMAPEPPKKRFRERAKRCGYQLVND